MHWRKHGSNDFQNYKDVRYGFRTFNVLIDNSRGRHDMSQIISVLAAPISGLWSKSGNNIRILFSLMTSLMILIANNAEKDVEAELFVSFN